MARPVLLDLFCGAGGCSVGYNRAGFDVVGVDIVPQKHYPFEFYQMDAFEFLQTQDLTRFAVIHASPPCQAYTKCQPIRNNRHPDLIGQTRSALKATGHYYIIENVPGAPLMNPVLLVGTMFGLRTMRTRLFECSFDIPFFLMPPKCAKNAKMGRLAKEGEFVYVVGKGGQKGVKEQWQIAMGIDWMTVAELAQAIPPAYTEFIGKHLIAILRGM